MCSVWLQENPTPLAFFSFAPGQQDGVAAVVTRRATKLPSVITGSMTTNRGKMGQAEQL